jgi:hypothetical protein
VPREATDSVAALTSVLNNDHFSQKWESGLGPRQSRVSAGSEVQRLARCVTGGWHVECSVPGTTSHRFDLGKQFLFGVASVDLSLPVTPARTSAFSQLVACMGVRCHLSRGGVGGCGQWHVLWHIRARSGPVLSARSGMRQGASRPAGEGRPVSERGMN